MKVVGTPQFLGFFFGRGTLRVPDTGREASCPYDVEKNRKGIYGDEKI